MRLDCSSYWGDRLSIPKLCLALVIAILLIAPAKTIADSDLPLKKGDEVWNFWKVTGIDEHPEFIRYTFEKDDQATTIEITYKRQDSDWSTKYYKVQPAPGQDPPIELLQAVKEGILSFEQQASHEQFVAKRNSTVEGGKQLSAGQIAWHPRSSDPQRSALENLFTNPRTVIQLLMIIGLGLLLSRFKFLMRLARKVERKDWLFLGAWIGIGAVLRLIGGIRVPGFTNCSGYAHGFSMLRDVLVWDPLQLDPHGSGFHALYGLAISILPKAELSIIACQFVLSVLCIPLTYFVARFWLRSRDWSIWSAAVMAVLPIQVFFATTEVRLLPGIFFMLLALASLGMAIRDKHPLSMFASVLLGIVATQFYPIMMFLPAPLLLLLLSSQSSRKLLRSGWAWAAIIVFLCLWLAPALWMMSLVTSTDGTVIGSDFLGAYLNLDLLFKPSFSLEGWQTYNIFLNRHFTPPVLVLVMLVGLIIGCRRRETRFAAISVFACAIIFTIPGFFPGRMNLARLQQAAQPFYAILVGIGIGWGVQQIGRLLKRFSAARVIFGALILLGAIAVWPGPIGHHYTLQLERRFFLDALEHIDDGGRVIWAPSTRGTNHSGLPSYLAEERGRDIDWGALESNVVPKELLSDDETGLYYYRSSTCYTKMPNESRAGLLRPICDEIERQMELEEVFVRGIPSISDDMAKYMGEEIRIGFYRVKSIRQQSEKPEISGEVSPAEFGSERIQTEQIIWLAGRKDGSSGGLGRLFSNSKFLLQLILIAGVCLLMSRLRFLTRLASNVSRNEWIFLTFWITAGALLRLLGGVRVPGFTSCLGYAHGYSVLRDVLVHDPHMIDPHGSGFHALHGLTTSILPSSEMSVVSVQFILSVLCIPLAYFVARFWLKNRNWALWTAAIMAVLPVQVFFATTEVRMLPGVFFMLLTLACAGTAMRDKHPATLFATALFGVVCTQFYPTLMLLPAIVFVFVLASKKGRILLSSVWTWLAAALFTIIWMAAMIFVITHVFGQESEKIGSSFVDALAKFYLFFVPVQSFAGNDTYSVFLNHNFTPIIFAILSAVGIFIGCFRKESRFATISILVFAFGFTIVGLFPGRLTPARLQQAALVFYVILAGIGTGWIVERIRGLAGRYSSMAVVGGAAILFGSIAIWPGVIGKHYVHQNERSFFIEAIGQLDDNCSVVWAPSVDGVNFDIPSYSAEERGREISWGALTSNVVPSGLKPADQDSCLYYYRSSTCYAFRNESRDEPLQRICREIERQMELEEVFVKKIPAVPDAEPDYAGQEIEIGFYKVLNINQ